MLQVTAAPVREGARYAFTEASSPAFTDREVCSISMPVSSAIVRTWMVAEADRVGRAASVAVIVASPAPTALTSPVSLTVATASSEEDHTRSVTFAFAGSYAALSVIFSPATIVVSAGERARDVIGMVWKRSCWRVWFLPQSHAYR